MYRHHKGNPNHNCKGNMEITTNGVERPFICSYCVNSFKGNTSLYKRMKVHTNERPHIDFYCNMGFHFNYELKQHIPVHEVKKTFICSQCEKSFRTSSILQKCTMENILISLSMLNILAQYVKICLRLQQN